MPWRNGTREAAVAGLRRAAFSEMLTPHAWIDGIMTDNDGNCTIYGCAWGQICWAVALVIGGESYAREMLPIHAGKRHMRKVLFAAGLTRREIRRMNPLPTWQHFDDTITGPYKHRVTDPDSFIEASVKMANYFEGILMRVPTEEQAMQLHRPSLVSRILWRPSPQPDTEPLAA